MIRASTIAALALALLAPALARAQRASVESSGPRASVAEREVVRALEGAGVTVAEGAQSRVSVIVSRRGRRFEVAVTLRDASGERASERFANRRLEAIAGPLGRWVRDTLAPAVLGAGSAAAPPPERASAPARQAREPARAAARPAPAPERASSSSSDAPARVPPFAFHAGIAVTHRAFGYTDDIYAMLRPYRLAAAPFARLGIEWFPGAHFDSGAFGGFSVGVHGELGIAIASRDAQGIDYPTEAWGLGVDLRYRLRVDDVVLGVTAGYRTSTFALSDADELSPRPDLPNVQYHSIRAGGSFRWDLGLGFFVVAEAAYLHPFDAGEITSAAWFPRAQVGGIDVTPAVGLRVDDVELVLAFEYVRFFYDMRSEPGDPRAAGGALDERVSGVFSLVFTPSGL
ncbi:MAG: hypothetical protein KF729_31840 [Sandaracinaceae bacterium]|nr:hypothetical protein [Sandaracinaceae bacterium]